MCLGVLGQIAVSTWVIDICGVMLQFWMELLYARIWWTLKKWLQICWWYTLAGHQPTCGLYKRLLCYKLNYYYASWAF
jgi:hypothetical protein